MALLPVCIRLCCSVLMETERERLRGKRKGDVIAVRELFRMSKKEVSTLDGSHAGVYVFMQFSVHEKEVSTLDSSHASVHVFM